MNRDLELALHLADLADAQTLRCWSSKGVGYTAKSDGSPVTGADVAAERAVLDAVRRSRPDDGFLGEEVGEQPAASGRRWIVDGIDGTRYFAAGVHVSTRRSTSADRVVTLPALGALAAHHQRIVARIAGGDPADRPWSHQNRVAEGEVDLCVWFCGDVWDHAAPSILVEEAGGRFSDHCGGRRLDTRTAVYSNGVLHDEVLERLSKSRCG